MKKYLLLLFMSGQFTFCIAQTTPSFKSLRYDEDYSFLKDDSSKGWYSRTKFRSIRHNPNHFISFGGDIRYQYLYLQNDSWGDEPEDKDGYTLTRILAHADLHAGTHFRTFVQLQSSLANGKVKAPSAADENQLDLHQAFFDLNLPSEGHTLLLRVGRQELSYGSQRLVSVREGPNNRQSFDAMKLVYTQNNLKYDLFFSHYVQSRNQIFDDGFNKNTQFWGAYGVVNEVPLVKNIDLYYLGLKKNTTSFDNAKGSELRHSLGTRIWRNSKTWQYDFEFVYQWGALGENTISSWTASSNTSYNLSSSNRSPRLNLKTELISGDKAYGDGVINTFNPLFPRGGYFGLASLIGPSNLADIHPGFSLELLKPLELNVDYDFFWRYSANDGIYAPNAALIYSGKNSDKKFIGGQLAADVVYTPNAFLYFRTEFTWFQAGDYVKEVSRGKDIFLTAITIQLKF